MSTTKTIKISQGKVLDYSIKKDGFKPIIGSSLITSDKSINVNMVSTESQASVYNFGDRIGGIATVVGEFSANDGKKYAFAVLDAKYMGRTNWASNIYYIDTGLPNYTSSSDVLAAKESATYNTDYILNNYSGSLEAFNHARNAGSVELGGKTIYSQLPNAYELQQIFNFRNELRALDPTASSYTAYDLASWSFNSATYAWCSNEYNSNNAWYLNSSGSWYRYNKLNDYGVVPVLEIEIS